MPVDRNADRRAVARQARPIAARKVSDEELLREVLRGRYRLQGVLGQGGMGTVYEAVSERTGETVALKVLKAEQVEKKEAVERMRHEATVVARIRHPNICSVVELGAVQEGRPYLAMELLRGETLAKKLEREKRIQPTLGVEIAIQALAALDAAHRCGVIHRDMKPDNIFLISGGGVLAKVLDFGISKATSGDDKPHNLTRTGMVMGTPYYMAPEQAMGERTLDARVDVWGVGVLLYEALTGQRPFVAKNYNALLVQILTATPEPAAVVRPQIPVGLSNVIHRALAKKRDERFSTAQEFAKALVPFRQEWQPPPAKEKAFRQTARSRAIQVAVTEGVAEPLTPSPASRRTVRMVDAVGAPEVQGVSAEHGRQAISPPSPGRQEEAPIRSSIAERATAARDAREAAGRGARPMAEGARRTTPLAEARAEHADSSAAPTQRAPEQRPPLHQAGRGLVAQTSVPRLRPASQAPPPMAAAVSPARASQGSSRRRSTEPPKMVAFDTADSNFSVSTGDEEPTQLYDGHLPVGDDTPTIEENDLTVVDPPFALEDYERRSR